MEIVVMLVIILALLGLVFWLLAKPKVTDSSVIALQQQLDSVRAQMAESLKNNTDCVNQQLVSLIAQVNKQLDTVTSQVGERLDNNTKVVTDIHGRLGTLTQASERIFEVGKDIASLQEVLKAPKLRGSLGEMLLGDLLGQVLPNANFELQHKFRSGEIVDAVIYLAQGMVPVDAKFPLENLRKVMEAQNEVDRKQAKKKFISDVKKHIDAVATKYILPDEGTYDFVLMYVPAENVYYETIIKDETLGEDVSISSYALERKVIPVSPNSFYAYMQAIVLGLRGMRIEKSAEEIIRQLARLKGDFERFQQEFDILGKHITNIKNKYDDSARRLDVLGEKLISTGDDQARELPAETITKDL
jgi:DNA recombination protein RmuC